MRKSTPLASKFFTNFIAWSVEPRLCDDSELYFTQDVIRQGLSPEYYRDPVTGEIAGIPPKDWPEHLGHCIENLRQSMMCASDIRYT